MIHNCRHLSLWGSILCFFLFSVTAQAHSPERCNKALQAKRARRQFDSAEQQLEYIRLARTGTEREQKNAFDNLYRNYEGMIDGMARKYASLLAKAMPGSHDDYLETFQQVGRMALLEAVAHYKMEFPKPGTYIWKYVHTFMLDVFITRDGQQNPPQLVRKKMNNEQRRMFFAGELDQVYESMGGAIPMRKLKELYKAYSIRSVSLEHKIMGDDPDSALSLGDTLIATGCDPLKQSQEQSMVQLVTKARSILRDQLSERDRMIADQRLFCDSDDSNTLRDLSAEFGISHERVRQIDRGLRDRFRQIVLGLVVNETQFLNSLSHQEAEIAKARIFATEKIPLSVLARRLKLSRLAMEENEAAVMEKLGATGKQRIRELLEENPETELGWFTGSGK